MHRTLAAAAVALAGGLLHAGCASSRSYARPPQCPTCQEWDGSHDTHPLRHVSDGDLYGHGGGLDARELELLTAYRDALKTARYSIEQKCEPLPILIEHRLTKRYAELTAHYEATLAADVERGAFAAFLIRCQDYLPMAELHLRAIGPGKTTAADRRTARRLADAAENGHLTYLKPTAEGLESLVHSDWTFSRAVNALEAAHAAGRPGLQRGGAPAAALLRWRRRMQLQAVQASLQGEDAFADALQGVRQARAEAEEHSAASLDHALDAGVWAGHAEASAGEAAAAAARAEAPAKEAGPPPPPTWPAMPEDPTRRAQRATPSSPPPAREPKRRRVR
jgi:hypothetical protein